MKTLGLRLIFACLLAGTLTIAQEPRSASSTPRPEPNSERTSPDNSDIKSYTFAGCLSKAGINYIMLAEDGQTYKLNTTDNGFDRYVGKKISISARDNRSFNASSGAGGTPAQIAVDVQTVRQVSDQCSKPEQ